MLERVAALVDGQRERLRSAYASDIGRRASELATPSLLLDRAAAQRNIERMAAGIDERGSALRPHIKTHKSPELARMQLAAGAIGISAATVWEALVMAASGIDDIFIVNTVAGPEKIRLLIGLAAERRTIIAIDELSNAQTLADAARDAGIVLDLAIEVDTGMDRAGVDTPDAAAALAVGIADLQCVSLVGVTGYEGHCSLEEDVVARTALQRDAMARLLAARDAIVQAGPACPIVSAGGTRTWWLAASTKGVTEVQAGTYVLMDAFHSGLQGDFEHAVRIATTVISRAPRRLIVDAGSKTVADPDLSRLVSLDVAVVRFDEEHGVFESDAAQPAVGDVLQLIPGYAPSTINAFDVYHVVEDGVVVDIWPVVPRGPGHGGLAAIT